MRLTLCDKCRKNIASSKFVLCHDEKHKRGSSEWSERKKTNYDLCDECAMALALQIDEFADALVLDDYSEEE